MKCPVCKKHELVAQSLEDSNGFTPEVFCPEVVNVPGYRLMNHYREYPSQKKTRMIALPYRIITEDGKSKIGLLSKRKSGEKKPYFKTILTVPALHPDTPERLAERIKLLLLLS